MASIKDLISRARESKLSKAVQKVVQGEVRGARNQARAFTAPYRAGFQDLTNTVGQSVNALKDRQDLINQRTQGMSLGQRISRQRQPDERELFKTGLSKSAEAFGSVAMGAFPVASIASGALGFGASKLSGQSTADSFNAGISSAKMAPTYAALAGASNPLIQKVVPQVASGFAPRIASSVANVAQGIGIDTATGQQTTPLSLGIDAVAGLANVQGPNIVGKGAVATKKGITSVLDNEPKINDVINRYNTQFESGKTVDKADIDLIPQAEELWKRVFGRNKKPPRDLGETVGDLYQALEGIKQENFMKNQGYALGIVGDQPTKGVDPRLGTDATRGAGVSTDGVTPSGKAFVSERDLPDNNIPQPEIKQIAKTAVDNFKEYQKQLFKQEGATLSPRQQANKNLTKVSREVGKKVIPEYLSKDSLPKNDIGSLSIGFKDVYRNFETVFGKGSRVTKDVLEPFDNSKAKMVDDLDTLADNLDTNIIKKLKIKPKSKESAAVQQFGEGNRDYGSLVTEFGETKAKNIVEADKWFRSEYDRLLEEVNSVRAQIYPNDPTKIIPRRSDYYRHFTDLSNSFSGLVNLFENPAGIAPGLAGVSANTKPKSKWLSFAQKRLGNKTDEDAVGGYLEYVKAQTYAKHIDPHISKFRGLKDTIVNAVEESDNPSQLNNFIEFLDDFANDLAGKTNPGDRVLQKYIGRKPFKVLNWINNRTKANMIVGNLSSAIAQAFNVPQGIAEAGIASSVKGMGRTIASVFGDKTPIQESQFIKTRYAQDISTRFDKGILASAKKTAGWITGVLDEVGTKYIWNSLYDKAISQGIENPIRYADNMTRKMVAGRGIGEVPIAQKAKVFQLIAPFQLEVANVWHVMRDWAGEKAANKFITFFVASHFMNKAAEQIRGSDVSLDPIQASLDAYEAYQEEGDKKIGALRAGGRITGEVVSNLPLGQTVGAMYPEFGGQIGDTKLPTREDLFGEGDPTRFGSGLLATKGIQDPIYSLLPSYGGKQIKRTIEGIKAYNRGYSESKSGRLRYEIPKTQENQVRTGIFGEYSTKEAREYFDQKKSVLGEQQTEIYKSLPKDQGSEYLKLIDQDRKLNRIMDDLKEGAIDEKEAESLIGQVNASEEFSPLVESNNKLISDKMASFTKSKIKAGLPVTERELESVYLSKALSMPKSNRYEKAQRESQLYSKHTTINNDENLSESQKRLLSQKIAKELGVPTKTLEVYAIAKEDNDTKTMHALDQYENTQSMDDFFRFLANGRVPVNGKTLVSDGVIDNLVEDGIIPEELGDDFKDLKFDGDGKLIVKKKKGKKGKSIKTSVRSYGNALAKIKIGSPTMRAFKPQKINVKALTFGG